MEKIVKSMAPDTLPVVESVEIIGIRNDAIVFSLRISIDVFDNKSIVNSLFLLEIIALLQCLTYQLVLIPVRKISLGL